VNTIRVLLVDDEPDIIFVIGKKIRVWGYELSEAQNGRHAIEAIKNKKADIVVLDYMMPDMDGIETLKEIRDINQDIPVIMFTAHPDMSSIEGTEKLNVSSYVPKISMYSSAEDMLKSALSMAVKRLPNLPKS
jgi:two-component system, NtrC family, response regulator AtoC